MVLVMIMKRKDDDDDGDDDDDDGDDQVEKKRKSLAIECNGILLNDCSTEIRCQCVLPVMFVSCVCVCMFPNISFKEKCF